MGSQSVKSASSAYSVSQFEENYPLGIASHYWIRARNLMVEKWLREVGADRGEILDVGCGSGLVVNHLLEAGFSCRGVELGEPNICLPCAHAIDRGISVSQLPFSKREGVSSALLLDVVEHLENPRLLLDEVRESLPSLSHVLVTVPARQELWSNYDEHFGHYRRYSRRELENLLREAGFTVRNSRYFFHLLYLPMFVSARLGLSRTTVNREPTPRWLHGLAARFFVLDNLLCPGDWVGSSIMAHAVLRSKEGER
jgi:SAM-dependent methyltransferase